MKKRENIPGVRDTLTTCLKPPLIDPDVGGGGPWRCWWSFIALQVEAEVGNGVFGVLDGKLCQEVEIGLRIKKKEGARCSW